MLLRLLALLYAVPAESSVPRLLSPHTVVESVIPSRPVVSPLHSLQPLALQASPLLAASVDTRAPLESSVASGEKLVALLQGTPLKRVEAAEIVPNVIHLRFPTQNLLARTMLRFQEHYESPKYRGKAFTREEFAAWYKAQKPHGRFSYYKDWDGFNVPSRALRRFKKGDFDPLDANEAALLRSLSARSGRFYVIATAAKDTSGEVLRHEVAHGLWYTRPAYRRKAKKILESLDLKPVFEMLRGLGYHKSVWLDEAHAWIGDGSAALKDAGLKDPRPYAAARKKLLALQKEFVSEVF